MNPRVLCELSSTTNDLAEILNWLKEEDRSSGTGFYCNRRVIKSSFKKGRFLALKFQNKAIGFAVWHFIDPFIATIDILEIHPGFRKCGFAKIFVDEIISNLVSKNIWVVDLQCAPEESESFWRKMNFIDFPSEQSNSIWDRINKQLYRILVQDETVGNQPSTSDQIELWNAEPFHTNHTNATWTWNVKFQEDLVTLMNPIIHPCEADWRIRWT